MRSVLISLAAALVLVTSAGFGVARGTLPAEEGIVICHGNAAVTIWIDAHGNEVRHVQLCPDEGLFFKYTALKAPDLSAPDRITGLARGLYSADQPSYAISLPHHARGPPRPV